MRLVTGRDAALTPNELASYAAGDVRRHLGGMEATAELDAAGQAGAVAFAEEMARCSAACSHNPSFRHALGRDA